MKKTKLTILTEPILDSSVGPKTYLVKLTKDIFRKTILQEPNYEGHYGVTRSLISGLKKIGIPFNHNPKHFKDVSEITVVLSNVEALKQMIWLKHKSKIKKLIAGPNLMVFSNEFNGILASPEIDICLVPSNWVKVAYEEDTPLLKKRIKIWYAGIDEQYWKPRNKKPGNNALIYYKGEYKEFCSSVENLLKKYNWSFFRIIYGKYKKEEFKRKLSESRFAIFLSRSESQGLALAEAWSMNVPTLVWNPKKLVIKGRNYSLVSSCPYLSRLTGMEWKKISDLEDLILKIEKLLPQFSPRKWIINNMTDLHSARLLLSLINFSQED